MALCSCHCLLASFVALVGAIFGLTLVIWPQPSFCKDCPSFKLRPATEDHCAADKNTGFRIKDVQERGYALFRDFLSEEERLELMRIWESLPDDSVINPGGNAGSNTGYKQPALSGVDIFHSVPSLKKKIMEIARNASTETSINVLNTHNDDVGTTPVFFHTNYSAAKKLSFGWHQDTENYFYFQDLHNFMSIYVFLRKPDPRQAGVSLVPWDALEARCPELHQLVRGDEGVEDWGPGDFKDRPGGGMTFTDFVHDRSYVMDFHLDDLACTPELGEGDLLIFRGDALHRTQAHQSHRTSLNVLTFPQRLLDPEKLFSGGHMKYKFLFNSAQNYFHFLWIRGMHTGLSDWQNKAMMQVYGTRLYGGHYLRQALWPVRQALDLVL